VNPGLVGALLGCVCAVGLLLMVTRSAARKTAARSSRVRSFMAAADIDRLGPAGFVGACGLAGVISAVVGLVVTGVPVVGLLTGIIGCAVPVLLIRRRIRRRARALRGAWPEAVDMLVSAVRAGMSLPEAVSDLAVRGPAVLRPGFADFAADYRAHGSFADALARVQERLADPVADRVIIALRMAREVGGTDLGRILTGLSEFLREDARTRGEIEARYSWTINAARIAVAAPWITLILLCTRPETVAAYSSVTGAIVLCTCAGLSVLAYRVMMLFAALPSEHRIAR
jgi:tight adherence protein B